MGGCTGLTDSLANGVRRWAGVEAKAVGESADKAIAALSRADAADFSNVPAILKALKDKNPLQAFTFAPTADQPTFLARSAPKQIMQAFGGPAGAELPRGTYLFKSGARPGEEYRDVGDVVGSEVMRAGNILTPGVFVTTQTLKADGKAYVGNLQEMIPNIGELQPEDITKLNQAQLDELTQSHVGRWLISDHDGKPENYLKLANGRVETIDLGQMFKFFGEDCLDRHYDPNGTPSVFNLMADGYVRGRLNLDFSKGLEQARQFQAIPDAQYQAMLRPFAELRIRQAGPIGPHATVSGFLAAATARKNSLVTDLSGFYDRLAKERGLSGLDEAIQTFKPTMPDAGFTLVALSSTLKNGLPTMRPADALRLLLVADGKTLASLQLVPRLMDRFGGDFVPSLINHPNQAVRQLAEVELLRRGHAGSLLAVLNSYPHDPLVQEVGRDPLIGAMGRLGSEQVDQANVILTTLVNGDLPTAQVHQTVDAILDQLRDRGVTWLNACPDPFVQYIAQPHMRIYDLANQLAASRPEVRRYAVDELVFMARSMKNANRNAAARAIDVLLRSPLSAEEMRQAEVIPSLREAFGPVIEPLLTQNPNPVVRQLAAKAA
jgi:hypothetical protein